MSFWYSILNFRRIIMYRAVLFVAFIVVAVVADDTVEKCDKLYRSGAFHCCTTMHKKGDKKHLKPELKECYELPRHPYTCARSECLAKKRGYYGEDGELDKEAYENFAEKEYSTDKEVLELIKEKCINGDISKYGPEDMCDFLKMKHCARAQRISKCTEWSEKEICTGVKELFEECYKDA